MVGSHAWLLNTITTFSWRALRNVRSGTSSRHLRRYYCMYKRRARQNQPAVLSLSRESHRDRPLHCFDFGFPRLPIVPSDSSIFILPTRSRGVDTYLRSPLWLLPRREGACQLSQEKVFGWEAHTNSQTEAARSATIMGGMDARPRGYLSQELCFVLFQHEKGTIARGTHYKRSKITQPNGRYENLQECFLGTQICRVVPYIRTYLSTLCPP